MLLFCCRSRDRMFVSKSFPGFTNVLYQLLVFSILSSIIRGDNLPALDWWQKAIIYQVYPRSFMDSNGDGVGDLQGIESKADYFKELGVGAVWLNPIYKSPMKDFGYDISNYTDIYEQFGTIDDLKSLKKKLHQLGIKLILDFVPNHTSDQSEWFQNSIKQIEPYKDFYVWKDPKGYDSDNNPIPPNNWISVFNINPAWTYNAERRQFYLHEFLDKQPDLNYRCPELRTAMENVIKFWLDAGVDGFRIDAVPFLVEDDRFLDESYIDPSGSKNEYTNMIHNYTMDQPLTFDVIRSWRQILDSYTTQNNVDKRVMLTEAYTDLRTTMKYYGNASNPISEMPFNFQLVSNISSQSNAVNVANSIRAWLRLMPSGQWANWVIGNHDQFRVATRYGTELVDSLNMLVTLLPGTTITYYGEELGMEDTFVRWDQTVDPAGIVLGKSRYLTATRDPARTPMQWDNTDNAGFSTADKTWLPVNPNFWRLNVKKEENDSLSHLKIYKRMVEARTMPTIQHGDFALYTPNNWTLIFTRSLVNYTTFIVVINMGTEEVNVNLATTVLNLPSNELDVYAASVNSVHQEGDKLTPSFKLRPKAGVVLTLNTTLPSSSAELTKSLFILLVSFAIWLL